MASPPPPALQDHDPLPLRSLLLNRLHKALRFMQSRLRPCPLQNNLLPVTTQNSITRIRCYDSSFHQQYSRFGDHQPAVWIDSRNIPRNLRLPCFDIELQTSNQHQPRRESSSSSSSRISQQGKIYISLTYQVAASLAQSSSLGRDSFFASLAKVNVVMAFAASFSGLSLRNVYPRISAALATVSSLCAAVGFFATTATFLPANLMWVGWLASGFSLLAFFLSFIN